jgi:Fur family ferric uptake transcriptional regulator
MGKAFEHFKEFIKQKGLRLTGQREAIVKMFLAKKGHLCVDELYYALRKKDPHIGYVTVYRTLKLLKEAKMASEVNFIGKKKRFEQKLGHPAHAHLICLACGKVIEFTDPGLEKRQEELCKKYKFRNEKSMKIFGVCEPCQKKEK